jgi:hypothetical protein
MMASPCGVVGTSEVVTPPRSRLSPSPGVRRGGDRLLESRSSPSPGVGQGGDRRPRRGRVRALGSGEAETVFRSRGGVRALGSGEAETVFRSRGGVRALGSGEAETVVRRSRWSPSPGVGRGGDSYGARGWTWLLSASPWRVARQSEQRRRCCFPVRSVSGGAK